ncbi:MAG: hypothetical protein U1F36_12860 [Planctomycetota bacterium]
MASARAVQREAAKRWTLIGVPALVAVLTAWLSFGGATERRMQGSVPKGPDPVSFAGSVQESSASARSVAPSDGGGAAFDLDRAGVPLAPWMDDVGDADPQRAPRSEREHYRFFLQLLRRDATSADALVHEVLDGDSPDGRRIALLRALLDLHHSAAEGACLQAITRMDAVPSAAGGGSLAVVTAMELGRHAAIDPVARRVLETAAFERGARLPADLRRRMAAAWAASIDDADIDRFPWRMHAEVDAICVQGMISALRDNPHREAVARLLDRLGLDRAAAEPTVPSDG